MSRPFRFGILAKAARPGPEWTRFARAAEADGFDVLLLPDHVRPQLAPFPALAAAAAATSTLRLGTLVINTDMRNPLLLAHEAATVDLMSQGRLELGVGAGWARRDYTESGIAWQRGKIRAERCAETITVLRHSWAGERFSFRGTYFDLVDVRGGPHPVQRPLPLLVGAGSPAMLASAAEHAQILGLARSMAAGPSAADAARDATAEAVDAKLEIVRSLAGDRFSEIELNVLVVRVVFGDAAQREATAEAAQHGLTVPEVLHSPQQLFAADVAAACAELRQRRERHGISYVAFREDDLPAAREIVATLRGS